LELQEAPNLGSECFVHRSETKRQEAAQMYVFLLERLNRIKAFLESRNLLLSWRIVRSQSQAFDRSFDKFLCHRHSVGLGLDEDMVFAHMDLENLTMKVLACEREHCNWRRDWHECAYGGWLDAPDIRCAVLELVGHVHHNLSGLYCARICELA
jgi:hypothetical protein